jgi:hypothetical protein
MHNFLYWYATLSHLVGIISGLAGAFFVECVKVRIVDGR